MAQKFLAFAFKTKENREAALKAVNDTYRNLQTSEISQILCNGYQYVLFVEDCSSLTFNLELASLMKKFDGISREKVRI